MSGAIDAQAPGDLMDGWCGISEAIVQLEHDLEQKDDLARRLLDQCRYQHLVLTEIAGLSYANVTDERRSFFIHTKAQAAIAAANKSGLLA